MKRTTLIIASLSLALAGCALPGDLNGNPNDHNDPNDPTNPDPKPVTSAVVAGTYTVVTTFDLTLDVVLPGQAYDVVIVLEDFRADPASTMFQLLSDAGVPVVGELLDVLPSSLEDRLMGWINDYLQSAVFDEVPVMDGRQARRRSMPGTERWERSIRSSADVGPAYRRARNVTMTLTASGWTYSQEIR